MNITDIGFKNPKYSGSFEKKLTGNLGDPVDIKISFSTTVSFSYINFWSNFINTSSSPYVFGSFELQNGILKNICTESFTRTEIDALGGFTIIQPKQSEIATNYVVNAISATDYELIISTFISPFISNDMINPQDSQLLQNAPFWAYSGDISSLKYIFRMQLLDANKDEFSPTEDTQDIDIRPFFRTGNIGAYGETFDGLQPKYSVVNADNLDNYNPAYLYNVTAQIQMDALISSPAFFDNTFDVDLFFCVIPYEIQDYNPAKNYTENIKLEIVSALSDGIAVNGTTYISNFTVNVNGLDNTLLDVSFDINEITDPAINLQYQRVVYWFSARKSGVPYYNNTIPVCKIVQPAFAYYVGQLLLERNPAMTGTANQFNFINWWNAQPLDNALGYSECVAFIADDQTVLCRITNTNNTSLYVGSFKFGIKNTVTGTYLTGEEYTKSEADVAAGFVVTSLGFQRNGTNQHNQISFTKTNAGLFDYYDLSYGFNLQDNSYSVAGLSFVVEVTYKQSILGTIQTNIVEFRSAPLRVGQFSSTLNVTPDAILLPDATNRITLYPTDAAGNIIGAATSNLIPSISNYWEAQFQWLDTRAIPDKIKLLADECGYIFIFPSSLAASPKQWLRINTIFDDPNSSVLLKTLASSANRAEKIDYPSATPPVEGTSIRARIDIAQYKSYFNTSESPCLVARLDFIPNTNPNLYEITLNFKYGVLNELVYQLTDPLIDASFSPIFDTLSASCGFYYGATIGTMILYPSFAAWKSAVASAVAGEYIKITNSQVNLSASDAPAILTYKPIIPITTPFVLPLTFVNVGSDIQLPFSWNVQVTAPVADCLAGLRLASAAATDFGLFPYDISTLGGVAALNLAIAGLSEPTDYVIHIFSKTRVSTSISLGYSTRNIQRLIHLEEDNNYKYRTAFAGNATGLNGIGQYEYIPNSFNQAALDRGQTFTALFAFHWTSIDPNPFIFSTTTWKGSVIKGFRAELIFGYFTAGWQTAGGSIADQLRADKICNSNTYNIVMLEFTGNPSNIRMWINKCEAGIVPILLNNAGSWTIQNGYNDAEIGVYASQAGGGNYFSSMIKKIQFVNRVLSNEEREKAINAGTMEGIVTDPEFIFDADLSVVPATNRAGTPAFTANAFGGVTNPVFLP